MFSLLLQFCWTPMQESNLPMQALPLKGVYTFIYMDEWEPRWLQQLEHPSFERKILSNSFTALQIIVEVICWSNVRITIFNRSVCCINVCETVVANILTSLSFNIIFGSVPSKMDVSVGAHNNIIRILHSEKLIKLL